MTTDQLDNPQSTAPGSTAPGSTGHSDTRRTPRSAYAVFSALAGLTALGIILQGVWAGIFLSYDERPDNWVHIHDVGAQVTLVLSVLTAIWAVWKLRADKPLVIGSILQVLLIAGEAHIGGLITDNGDDKLAAVHVPLAMALLGLAVWLPMRARRLRERATSAELR